MWLKQHKKKIRQTVISASDALNGLCCEPLHETKSNVVLGWDEHAVLLPPSFPLVTGTLPLWSCPSLKISPTAEVICIHLLYARSKCQLTPKNTMHSVGLTLFVCFYSDSVHYLFLFLCPQNLYITSSTSSVIPYLSAWTMKPFHESSILLIYSWLYNYASSMSNYAFKVSWQASGGI